ncbi:P-loop containing nucleoside triphosphate hydrolase protein [Lineolata rhizophorae]|uniref:Ribosome-releasing factor 2, mitochondrial n=1 Tax=Lineolata rhizophorae TaxID=578093 RepID=A0A6A6NXT9_9PEZI|nr:P-loop containing nucleoside triphosphate hydrolase protein [Lineolata rhizophorae]
MLIARLWPRGRVSVPLLARTRLFSATAVRQSAPSTGPDDDTLARTRNIGIIAHIDAGKTTTTERMLYYSGYTRRIGDVDEGSTVTDFLPAERTRGITIQSAAITFNWPPTTVSTSSSQSHLPSAPRSSTPHTINLIDTPGHADFTFEVVRSLRILDGAVCILDGVAGVEAQTEKVWAQASAYAIPRLAYVNKLDRDGAAFARTIKEIGVKLRTWPAVCQVPWWEGGRGRLLGVGDVVGRRGMKWERGGDGRDVQVVEMDELDRREPWLAKEIERGRAALVELLSEHDDEMVEKFLEAGENHQAIAPSDITDSLRRVVLHHPQKIVPVFGGASFRNIGVQPLLDAVVDLLPSPGERPDPEIKLGQKTSSLQALFSGELELPGPAPEPKKPKALFKPTPKALLAPLQACALAFKVVRDPQRGMLVYVRIYSGTLPRGAALYNTNLHQTERAQRLLRMYASDAVDVESLGTGTIGVIPGLKHARTGDTLVAYAGVNPKTGPPDPIRSLQLRPIEVPPPVFFTSVEPDSLGEKRSMDEALGVLLREDPSLSMRVNEESGQTELAGMGELHLEIARDRLIGDFKAKARTGKIDIDYRETITVPSRLVTERRESDIQGKKSVAECSASVAPASDVPTASSTSSDDITTTIPLDSSNTLTIHHAPPPSSPDPSLPPHLLTPLTSATSAALSRGPAHALPTHSIAVHIHLPAPLLLTTPDTVAPAALSLAARAAVRTALAQASAAGANSVLMEPVMLVRIAVSERDMGGVVHDISAARGGVILALDESGSGEAAAGASASSASNDAAAAAADAADAIDPHRIYAPPDPFTSSTASASADLGAAVAQGLTQQRTVTARVPLKEMVGYLKHLRSLTGGRGTFVMSVEGFERMGAQRERSVLGEIRGEGW